MAVWTTDDVRFWVSVGGGNNPVAHDALKDQFDAWLEAHDKHLRAEGWYEGHYDTTSAASGAWFQSWDELENPYLKEEEN